MLQNSHSSPTGKKGIKCVCFCTVSSNLKHEATAVRAHLNPVFHYIKTLIPNLRSIDFTSEGPTTQYKNKTNFFLFKHFCNELGLDRATWNFTTAGHGKSHADGAGGKIEGLCDRAVGQGRDVLSSEDIIREV